MRRLLLSCLVLALGVCSAHAQLIPFHGPVISAGVANTMLLTNKTGATLTNYPMQIGRQFLPGAIAHFPQIVMGGVGQTTQANVLNRWPDGSVKFAALMVIAPTVASGGTSIISFQDQATANNAPLTTSQMTTLLAGDATMKIDTPASVGGFSTVSYTAWAAINNGSFCVSVDGAAAVCPVIDFTGVVAPAGPAVSGKINTALAALGVQTFVYGDPNAYSFTIQTKAIGTGHTIAIAAPPSGTDITPKIGWTPALATTQPGSTTTISVTTMLNAGKCTTRLPGPIAQTIMCADDTAAAAYDVGSLTVKGDAGGHKALRPRFYLTFWPSVSKVEVRYMGDATKSTEMMDQRYQATLGLGGSTVYTLDLLGANFVPACNPSYLEYGTVVCFRKHWFSTAWAKSFWLGTSPPDQVDIDPNLVYMTSTRFIPNFDPSMPLTPTDINNYYAGWAAGNNEPYDGGWDGGAYLHIMGNTGARQELGPYPTWNNDWLYTGAWQMRKMSKIMGELALAFPLNIRETQTGKRLLRTDTAGTSGGLGLPLGITDHKHLSTGNTSLILDQSYVDSRLTVIGPIDFNLIWTYDSAHLPDPFYIPYLMTGDPFYLDENNMWAHYAALNANGASTYYYAGRGPTGMEGGITGDTVRGNAWPLRQRVEAAFIAPDGDQEKTYLTALTNDTLARWEGAVNITGTPYQTQPVIVGSQAQSFSVCPTDCNEWTWGHIVGNHEAPNMPSTNISPLHEWESMCDPHSPCDASFGTGGPGSFFTAGVVGSNDSPWMNGYWMYALLRAAELGFAAQPLATWNITRFVNEILDSGNVTFNSVTVNAGLMMTAMYRSPVASRITFDWFPTWPAVAAAVDPGYMTGTGPNLAYPGGLPGYFNSQLCCGDYYIQTFRAVLAMGTAFNARGPAAYAALNAIIPPSAAYGSGRIGHNDSRWFYKPRTDTNVLPAIPPN